MNSKTSSSLVQLLQEKTGEFLKENLRVYVLPLVYFSAYYKSMLDAEMLNRLRSSCPEFVGYGGSTLGMVEFSNPCILLTRPYGLDEEDVCECITHEFGHLVHLAVERGLGFIHPRLQEYLKLRGVTAPRGPTLHELLPEEVFAEDFRRVMGGLLAAYSVHAARLFLPDPGELSLLLQNYFQDVENYLKSRYEERRRLLSCLPGKACRHCQTAPKARIRGRPAEGLAVIDKDRGQSRF